MKMKGKAPALILPFLCLTPGLIAQNTTAHSEAPHHELISMEQWFGIFELPFLFLCVVYAFKTARALKGGILGKGMMLMAWGFLVMAIGHLNMQAIHHFGKDFDLFYHLFGSVGGTIVWFIALIITWSLSGLGFYNIYKVSKG